jgi:hypothetical protein
MLSQEEGLVYLVDVVVGFGEVGVEGVDCLLNVFREQSWDLKYRIYNLW